MIVFERVSVRYGQAAALAEVSATVENGAWLGIIGPNGAGKTTLLRAAARLVGHEGTIAIGGRPLAGLRRRPLARLVAYVPQRPELPPEMSVFDYVLLGRTPHIGYLRMETAADRDICAALLDRMALGPMARPAARHAVRGRAAAGGAGPGAGPAGAGAAAGRADQRPGPGPPGRARWNWWTSCAGNGR